MISRKFDAQVLTALKYFPVVTLTGARQTGKTTLLRNLLPDFNYVSLELPSIAASAEETPDRFLEKYKPPLIIDKIQYAPKIFRYLKEQTDRKRHKMGRIVLTGSQKFELMQNLSESLAGRTAVLELEGLDWDEYKNAPCFTKKKQADFRTFIFRGGFPELTRKPSLPPDLFFSSYLATYLERDIRQIVNVQNLRIFEQFIRLLATRNSQQLDMTDLASNLGISPKTAGAWIGVLETSGQISLLQPWHGNFGKRIVKTPKVYFNDTGLLCWLLGIEESGVKTSPFAGGIFEAALFAQLRKANRLNGSKKHFYYYRDVSQTEIDFFIIGGGCKMVECKLTEHAKSDDAHAIKKLHERLSSLPALPAELQPTSFSIVCNTAEDYLLPLQSAGGTLNVQVQNIRNAARGLISPGAPRLFAHRAMLK